jgi:CDP-diacylglycerol--glycerol-3-phosphate 3-phosphatidyltransferase
MAEKIWNIPNALAAFRLAGSIVLVGVAVAAKTSIFTWLLLALLISDWLDGKLAILLRQRTTFGARLDSVADAAMYGAMLVGVVLLKRDFVLQHGWWIAAALATFALSVTAGWIKYGRPPSYHTRAAKTCWLLVGIAAVVVFGNGAAWPFKLAMAAVAVTNLEATVMTLVLPEWRADVPSLWHAWRWRHAPAQTLDNAMHDQREQAERDQYEQQVPGPQRP